MQTSVKNLLPHLLVIALFIVAAVGYFSPAIQGKQIYQSDIVQYSGMAKQHKDHRAETGEETFWTNSAFGGMPTYQLGAEYPHNYIKKLDRVLRFLPRPADYLFLYFLCFYILMLTLKVGYRPALAGALAFGLSTYLIIILGVGHNAKAHAIAYMPLVFSGLVLTFRKKYMAGFLLTAMAMALEVGANHFQMTYYMLLSIGVFGIAWLVDAFRKKQLPHYFKSVGITAAAFVLGIGMNATNLLATKEYAAESTRGQSALTIEADGSPKKHTGGLSRDYITEYSYGLSESFNLFIPRFKGGANAEDVGTDSATYDLLLKMGASPVQAKQSVQAIPTYWGEQPIVAAPAYIGAVALFLALMGLFLTRGKVKWWLTGSAVLALMLSWGKNFGLLTDLFIDHFPLYNKFRAVSSIQVIVEMCLPVLAALGVYKLLSGENRGTGRQKALGYSAGILGGLAVLFLLFKNQMFSFAGLQDSYYAEAYGYEFVEAVRQDRVSIFTKDTVRSLVLVALAAASVWLYIAGKIKQNALIALVTLLVVFDLAGVDRRYVNDENFVAARDARQPFDPTAADTEILSDEGYFRVFDLSADPFKSARAGFFHHSLGGYHAAKPGRVQELYDFYLDRDIHPEVLNMYNVRYLIARDEQTGTAARPNPDANGSAWLVSDIKWVENADEEITALREINTKETAIVHREFSDVLSDIAMTPDSLAHIGLVSARPDRLTYKSTATSPQLAVFSENYYPHGWQAYIDGGAVPHFRANYSLRALVIPEGTHEITFEFDPQVVKTGSRIALMSSLVFGLLVLGSVGVVLKSQKP